MKYAKIASLVFFMAFASAPICPVAAETRITEIENVYVKHGDKAAITACGQLNNGSGWTDIDAEYLYFAVSDSKGEEILNKIEKISFWEGNASINIDTNNLAPGNYTIHVKFMGNKYLHPSESYTTLVVM